MNENYDLYGELADGEAWNANSDDDLTIGDEEEKSTKKRGRKSKVKCSDEYGAYERGEIIDFIGEIEKHPIVWDPSNKDWHRGDVKKKVFMEIEKSLKRFVPKWPRYPGRVAENLWNQISKDYSVHAMRVCKAKSGSGVDDVTSTFKFAEHLSFLNGPKKMRETKNSFVIGSREHQKMETPKRPSSERSFPGATPKQAKTANLDVATLVMQSEMQKTREMMAEVFGKGAKTECASERVCKIFRQLVENLDEIEKIEMESKVVSFMFDMRRQNSQPPPSPSSRRPAPYASRQSSQSEEFIFQNFDSPSFLG